MVNSNKTSIFAVINRKRFPFVIIIMSENFKRKEITQEVIDTFLNGHDPETGIVNIEYSYKDDFVTVYRRNERDEKEVHTRPFYPFVWARKNVATKLRESAEKKAWTVDNYGNSKLYITERYQPKDSNGNPKLKDGKPIYATRKKYVRDFTEYMKEYGIWFRTLDTRDNNGSPVKEMEDGYTIMFYATKPMSQSTFLEFFKFLGYPIYSDKKDADESKKEKKNYVIISPQEQYLIYTGKRFFKGYDDYNDILRMIFDLETTGLNTETDRIEQFGIRFNRPFKYNGKTISFERILTVEGETEEEKDASELNCIRTAFKIISVFDPDVITAHNGETFDWNMIIGALKRLGTSIEEESKPFFNGKSIYKSEKEKLLKLGGEIEKFFPTIVPGVIVTDSLHAVRRAQATDSNFAEGSLKYSIRYLNLQKDNRVYVPGNKITDVWNDNETHYAFNDKNGDWYLYDNENGKEYSFNGETKRNYIPSFNSIEEGYELASGRYIVKRYLLDDLWECDKVELALNQSAFNINKNLPLTFSKCVTMGTAGQWKALMMAWSFENGLAIPFAEDTGKFTGGLSRLLCVGASGPGLVKFDFNSLYPSIVLTWAIEDEKDITGVTLLFLLYFLESREKYKKLKKSAGKINEKYEKKINNGEILSEEENVEYSKALADFSIYDNRQAVRKVFCNSFFGAYGSNNGSVYPWKSVKCAERTTCTGRQMLRLMISYFKNLGYQPIVGDSVTGDTPLFIKYDETGLIDIKPISELMNEKNISTDLLGREYDYSKKDYKVLCRSGWVEPSYIYRHKANKKIYRVKDNDTTVDVTEDHSLFDLNKNKIKPKEMNETTKLEYFNDIDYLKSNHGIKLRNDEIKELSLKVANGLIDRVPITILNSTQDVMKKFYKGFINNSSPNFNYTKTCLSGIFFLKKCILISGK